ncbi:hypothetical protein DFJ73DRAFT_504497 [Zopfochytrium polystomum]|nr:hypothetical protein DFJ73DRAFT_504497 [Zopfochytrium polystomum]
MHCAVSDLVASDNQIPQLRGPSIGFDRLLEIGFSQEEVDNIRTQFHAMRGSSFNEQSEAARGAEEDWIDNRHNNDRDAPSISAPITPGAKLTKNNSSGRLVGGNALGHAVGPCRRFFYGSIDLVLDQGARPFHAPPANGYHSRSTCKH